MRIRFINKTRERVEESFVKRIIDKTFEISRQKARGVSLSVIFVGKEEIQSLNRAYRRKNSPTDVLSFDYSTRYNDKSLEGELFLCPEVIRKSAGKNKVPFGKELALVVSHGVLHLLGMKHGRKMYEIQDRMMRICE